MSRLRKNLPRYGIAAVIGVCMVIITLNTHEFWNQTELVDQYRVLTDAFTIPGLSLMGAGGLVWVSNKGVFNPISYATHYLAGHILPGLRGTKDENYYDYVTRKNEGSRHLSFAFLLIVGGVFFAIALVFYALFYTQFPG